MFISSSSSFLEVKPEEDCIDSPSFIQLLLSLIHSVCSNKSFVCRLFQRKIPLLWNNVYGEMENISGTFCNRKEVRSGTNDVIDKWCEIIHFFTSLLNSPIIPACIIYLISSSPVLASAGPTGLLLGPMGYAEQRGAEIRERGGHHWRKSIWRSRDRPHQPEHNARGRHDSTTFHQILSSAPVCNRKYTVRTIM